MKIKAFLASLIGAVAIKGATAGEWCQPAPADKCPIECCADLGASISVGYESDYIFYGARLAEDSVWADVNYTFGGLPVDVTVGIWYLSAFGAPDNRPGLAGYGDEADFYASVALPSQFGIDMSLGYTVYTFPTATYGAAVGIPPLHEVSLEMTKEVMAGVSVFYRGAYTLEGAGIDDDGDGGGDGAWVHTLGLTKSLALNDCIGVDLSAGVLYTDNYYVKGNNGVNETLGTGWNNYYLQAAVPISLSKCATLTPYVGYNGTPDGWILDGSPTGFGAAGANWGQNANDIFHWGVSLGVDF